MVSAAIRALPGVLILPFEAEFYARHRVKAVFVGHPLADRIPLRSDPAPARAALGLPSSGKVIAILPGSRTGEVQRLGPPFAATVKWLSKSRPGLSFVAPMAPRPHEPVSAPRSPSMRRACP
jgi:lipid-A-disaccharide synthase